jgi:hypothetical protein
MSNRVFVAKYVRCFELPITPSTKIQGLKCDSQPHPQPQQLAAAGPAACGVRCQSRLRAYAHRHAQSEV